MDKAPDVVGWFMEATMGNDAFWNLVAVMLIGMGMVYAQRSLEFGGLLDGIIAMTCFISGWFIFLSYDYSIARPIGIIIPFINVSIYIYLSWLMSQDVERVARMRMFTLTLGFMYMAAWFFYIYYKSRYQPKRIAALNTTGVSLILIGTLMVYVSIPRNYTLLTILGGREATENVYYGSTAFTPAFVIITAGWAFLAMNQVIINFFVA
jgi:hypothetical protein